MIYQTQAELDEALAYWQDALRLRDWRLKAEISYRQDMLDDEGVAACSPALENKCAHIALIHPSNFPDSPWPQDHEQSLVHELLHLHTEPIMPTEYDEARDIANEQAIECISWGLVKLKRG